MPKDIELSIVIPTYNEEGNIPFLYKKLKLILSKLNKKYEIIFIDDGSTDRTFEILEKLNTKDKNVRVIKFKKNFGQTAALDAGFKNSRGDLIISLDADLQNNPEEIPNFLKKLNEGYDVVCAWRYNRRDSFSKKIMSKFANFLRKILTKEKIHDSGCTFRIYKRECLKDLKLYGEMHRFLPALLAWKGFKIGEIKVGHHQRRYGKTKYGVGRILKGFLDLLIINFWMKYSARPIHFFGWLGLLSFFIGAVIGIYLSVARLVFKTPIADRPLLLLAMLLVILGVQFFIFGILADIMIKVYYRDAESYTIEKKL